MLTLKRKTLKPILESREGIHLTAYLINRFDVVDLKSQIRTVMRQSKMWLDGVWTTEQQLKFLKPLDSLLHDARILKQMRGNIGLFLNEDSFRILNIPIEVHQGCQIATSFHIKPLLRWLQGDEEYLFLGLEEKAAYLYIGNQSSVRLIDSFLYGSPMTLSDDGRTKKSRFKEDQSFRYVNEWIIEWTKKYNPKLFMAGHPSLVRAMGRNLTYKKAIKTPVSDYFSSLHAFEATALVRKTLKEESKKTIERALQDFRFAENDRRVSRNIFQISKAVVQGKVKKLIVTDEMNIFGKINAKTGELSIHPFDLDHEDDCVLDDLAQMVLSKGGEVIVAKKDEIPKGRPILAILDDEGENALQKVQSPAFVLSEKSA